MSRRAMPLFVLNLGAEMLYVLEERLVAQKVARDKAAEVLADIAKTLYSEEYMDMLFQPQELCSISAARAIFEKVSHSSVMRLNKDSMDRLLDLMLMTMKLHLQLCKHPRELLGVSLNHVDGVRAFITRVDVLSLLNNVRSLLMTHYTGMTDGQWFMVFQRLCTALQDRHTKVSMFMQLELQRANGLFVLPNYGPVYHGTLVPGVITLYAEDGSPKSKLFKAGTHIAASKSPPTYDPEDTGTELGINMYKRLREGKPVFAQSLQVPGEAEQAASVRQPQSHTAALADPSGLYSEAEVAPTLLATRGLDLLSQMVGGTPAEDTFRLQLFGFEDVEEAPTAAYREACANTVTVDASVQRRPGHLSMAQLHDELDGVGAQAHAAADNVWDLLDDLE